MFTIHLFGAYYGKFKTSEEAERQLIEKGYKKVEKDGETIYRLSRPKDTTIPRLRMRWFTARIFPIPTYKFNRISTLVSRQKIERAKKYLTS